MNSPWGIEYSIIKDTGWTRKYLLWGESWINIKLMIADAPAYRSPKKDKPKPVNEIDELNKFFNIK